MTAATALRLVAGDPARRLAVVAGGARPRWRRLRRAVVELEGIVLLEIFRFLQGQLLFQPHRAARRGPAAHPGRHRAVSRGRAPVRRRAANRGRARVPIRTSG